MGPGFSDLNFVRAYQVEVSPEFPGNGEWNCPVLGFDREGRVTEPFSSSWGTVLVLRITPTSSVEWIASFAAGGLGGLTGCYGSPSPNHLIAVSDGSGNIVDVTGRTVHEHIPLAPITQVERVPARDLVLLSDSFAVVAYGPFGRSWCTRRLAWDDLTIERLSADRALCRGDVAGHVVELELDIETGQQVAGPELT